MILEICEPIQYSFYVENTSKSYRGRIKSLSKINKLWNYVENVHRHEFTAFEIDQKACPICKTKK
jgi:hypothetical protein